MVIIVSRATILIVVLSVLLASCATTKTSLPTDNIDELLGTWVNTEYDRIGHKEGKRVWKADGTGSEYRKSTYDINHIYLKWEIKELAVEIDPKDPAYSINYRQK